jgi:3'-phosphoadenosine 5'-phosphosulfate sulfotransferase (PAPS reductase)/FAD synthetase
MMKRVGCVHCQIKVKAQYTYTTERNKNTISKSRITAEVSPLRSYMIDMHAEFGRWKADTVVNASGRITTLLYFNNTE